MKYILRYHDNPFSLTCEIEAENLKDALNVGYQEVKKYQDDPDVGSEFSITKKQDDITTEMAS